MDRTVATGTGFIGQYRPAVARMYESLATCPDDLLLFLHHVPYTYMLHSGKTVIQSIYDSHYEGAEAVAGYVRRWKSLEGPASTSSAIGEVLAQLEYQAGQAEVWRDAVTNWFLRASGIPDAKGRVGQLSRPRRSRVHDAGRLHSARRHALGRRLRRQSRRMRRGALHRQLPVRRRAGLVRNSTCSISTRPTASRTSACGSANQLIDEWAADLPPAHAPA